MYIILAFFFKISEILPGDIFWEPKFAAPEPLTGHHISKIEFSEFRTMKYFENLFICLANFICIWLTQSLFLIRYSSVLDIYVKKAGDGQTENVLLAENTETICTLSTILIEIQKISFFEIPLWRTSHNVIYSWDLKIRNFRLFHPQRFFFSNCRVGRIRPLDKFWAILIF